MPSHHYLKNHLSRFQLKSRAHMSRSMSVLYISNWLQFLLFTGCLSYFVWATNESANGYLNQNLNVNKNSFIDNYNNNNNINNIDNNNDNLNYINNDNNNNNNNDNTEFNNQQLFNNAHHYPKHRLLRIQRQLHQAMLQQQQQNQSSTTTESVNDNIISTTIATPTVITTTGPMINDLDGSDEEEKLIPTTTELPEMDSNDELVNEEEQNIVTTPMPTTMAAVLFTAQTDAPALIEPRIIRRRIKVRRSNEFDVLTPSDIALLRLNNKRKFLKKVIKLRKKINPNETNSSQVMVVNIDGNNNGQLLDNIAEQYNAETNGITMQYPTTIAPSVSSKREKIICLSMIKSNETDLTLPKCYYALNGNDNPLSSTLQVTEQPSNSISSSESDLLHTEESSNSRLVRHYMPPLFVPQTTTRSFFKRFGLFSSSPAPAYIPNSTRIANDNNNTFILPTSENALTTPINAASIKTTTTPAPLKFDRQAMAYNYVPENRGDENLIDAEVAVENEETGQDGSSSNNEEINGPFVNVYEYPQEPIQSVEIQNETILNTNNQEKPTDYYQLIDNNSQMQSLEQQSSLKKREQEQIVEVVVLPDNESSISSSINSDNKSSKQYQTTPDPLTTTINSQNDALSVKDLWHVTKRKWQPKLSLTVLPPANTPEDNSLSSTKLLIANSSSPTTASIFERYVNQQQQQTSQKRPLRIPKLLLPKVNRPAMYSLNGYVPKPQTPQPGTAIQSSSNFNQKNKTRRLRNRTKHRKGKNKSRRRTGNSAGSSTNGGTGYNNSYGWERKTGGKVYGKSDDDLEDDFDYDFNGNDMIETSETISHSHRRSDIAKSIVPSAMSNSRESSKRKSSTKTLKKSGNLFNGASKASLSSIPKTSFECTDKRDGVYADEETGCQVWHICQNSQMHSFLCPMGTIFSEKNGVCDWWYNTPC